ncbi:flagellar filament capping protein FliD [Benzoatithermus flavus]|uniref:Flagellar hook-associated protein 2 n=1 Tax=Benzoatithermus flavus TaxID=3108223 RepID=A0ABU8XQD4_9PROT
MPTGLNLGSLSTAGGVARLVGTSSQLDTEALVKAVYEAKRAPAVRLENSITRNEAKAAAFAELKGLLEKLQSSLDGLRNPPGTLGGESNLFEAKQAYLSSSTTTRPDTLVGLDIADRASVGTFALTVERLATAEKQATASVGGAGVTLADGWNAGSGFAGTLLIGLAGGPQQRIAVDGTMTLADLRAAINAKSVETGVTASIVKVSDTDCRLILTGTETGRAITLGSDPAGDDVLGRMGLSRLQAAQTSRIVVDGVTVERTGNTIDDLYEGVTLSLLKAEPGTTVTVGIEPDLASIKSGIRSFVDAYNAVRDFVAKQSAVDASGKVSEGAVLHGDSVLRSLSVDLAMLAGGSVVGLASGAPATLRDIGLGFDADNRLVIDGSRLDRKLLSDLDSVRGVLAFGFSASSPELRVLGRSNALTDTSFRLDIVDADADGVPESASIDGVAVDVTGGRIEGRAGTAYEGLELVWVGKGSTSIDVRISTGVADRLFNALDDALDELDGPIGHAIADLAATNEAYRKQIAAIDQRAEAMRARLVARYSAMETALSLAETMMRQVQAQMDAMTARN